MQELQCANVAMRIITDDNIEQIENMSFSQNIDKLMFSKDVKPSDVVNNIRTSIGKNKLKAAEKTSFVLKDFQESLRTSEDKLSKSKEYNPNTPSDYVSPPAYDMQSDEKSYNRPNSPEYAKGSPAVFTSPNSPLFVPMTPSDYVENSNENVYNPNSPEYAKGSPPVFGENGQTEYNIGDLVSRRGVQGNDNIWRIENVGPEFTTIKKYSPENMTGGGRSGNNFQQYDEVVVVDNNGGGIVSTLPQRGVDHFEEVFGTPHNRDLTAIAAGFGIHVTRVATLRDFERALTEDHSALNVIIAVMPSRDASADYLKSAITTAEKALTQ
jgi:hypothetical protein